MDLPSFSRSSVLKKIIAGAGLLALALLIFVAGEFVGERRAAFSYRWGANYEQNFSGPPRGLGLSGEEFLESNGVAGTVIKTGSSTLVVNDRDDVEKEVLVASSTMVRRLRNTISPSDIRESDHVVVIGSPNGAGQIEAKLIRVFPAPPPAGQAP